MGFFYSDPVPKVRARKAVSGPRPPRSAAAPAKPRKKRQLPLINLQNSILYQQECAACPMNAATGLHHPKMAPTGAARPLIYVLGEAPGADEDLDGEQFVGKSGQILRNRIPKHLLPQVRFNNCVRCRPKGNATPTADELTCCRKSIEQDIEASKPRVILGFGNVPLKWMTGEEGIRDRWRGRRVPVKIGEHACWYYPILHPAFVLRNQRKDHGSEWDMPFEWDLQRGIDDAVNLIEPPEIEDTAHLFDRVKLLYTRNEIIDALSELMLEPQVGLDIETVGLRPYPTDARILTIAIGTCAGTTYAFPLQWPGAYSDEDYQAIRGALFEFIISSGVKYCHNLSFEQEWLLHYYDGDPAVIRGPKWGDTEAIGYVNDSRKGMLNLETLIFLHFGFWLKHQSPVDVTNLINEPLEEVLKYNALDAKYTEGLAQRMPLIAPSLQPVYDHQIRTSPTLVLTQARGVTPDFEAAKILHDDYSAQVTQLEIQLMAQPHVQAFKALTGRDLNPDSNKKDLPILFRDIMKRPEVVIGKDKVSVAEPVLSTIKHPIATLILERRQLKKVLSTYIDTLGGLTYPDGLIHTHYKSNYTWTGRWSSENPNLQNWPIRRGSDIRKLIIPRPGHFFLPADYGQIEARVLAMASQDPAFCKALWEGYDIHMEWAERIGREHLDLVGGRHGLSDKDVMKKLRSRIKNEWVFPLFYGSSRNSVQIALALPDRVVRLLHHQFWKTFSAIRDWQDATRAAYSENGYVETLTGRRRYMPVGYNELINTPIQGTASDITVDAMNRCSEEGYQIVLNVHDDLTFELPVDVDESVIVNIAKLMCDVPFEWVNVPIVVEFKAGESWGDVAPLVEYSSTDFN